MSRLIRVAEARDAAEIAAIYRPYVTDASVSFELDPPDAAEMARRIEVLTESLPWLVMESDGVVAGYAYASKHRDRAAYQWSVEVSAYVRADLRRAGVARALYSRLFEVLERQGLFNAYAGITLPNDVSVAFHRALGFEPVGVYRNIGFKHGRWHDVAWLARALQPHRAPAGPPTPFSRELLA